MHEGEQQQLVTGSTTASNWKAGSLLWMLKKLEARDEKNRVYYCL